MVTYGDLAHLRTAAVSKRRYAHKILFGGIFIPHKLSLEAERKRGRGGLTWARA